ncbi:MAG: selenocysteine-specific translation elongation factor [Acidimicrobiia bacterium]
MPIVGTAGHVDHGKSSLVRALTGSDPDRLAEEKERGLTIDLGFAWANIDDLDVGFIDVPGHERFVKNMLAGVGALDCALLVVAADSGWMPQTEEHVAVLDLLEVDRGVIALTRIDLVDDDTRALAELEILDEIAGTTLEGWPIVPVSPVSGEGIEELRSSISGVLSQGTEPPSTGVFKMWIDRVFTVSGAGIIATGTVVSGSIAAGDDVQIQPGGATAKVRGIQHHGGVVDTAGPGSRTAVNLPGAPDGLGRGDVMVSPGGVGSTSRVLLQLAPTRMAEEVPARGAFHLHIGTASRPIRLRRLGETTTYVAMAATPVAALVGDRIIIRDSGRKSVVAGGRVLDPHPPVRPTPDDADTLASVLNDSLEARANALLEVHGTLRDEQIIASTGGGNPNTGLHAGDTWLSMSAAEKMRTAAGRLVDEYHADHPSRPGIPKSELASRLSAEQTTLEMVIEHDESLFDRQGSVVRAGFSDQLDPIEIERWEAVRAQMESSFDVPRMSDLDIGIETVHFLIRDGDLVSVGHDVAFTASQAEQIRSGVEDLEDGFTVSAFKDHFGMTRRQAVPTLEWLDAMGRTRREGDGRVVRGSGRP